MDQIGRNIGLKKFWKLYAASYENPFLLMDEISCHKQESFVSSIQLTGTFGEYISGGHIYILQPCKVSV